MASTNKTENYGLNQWVKSDPVLMDDMNADNKKIDAAMKGLAEEIKAGIDGVKAEVGMVRLGKYTSGEGVVNISFDLSGINVNDYSKFTLWIGSVEQTLASFMLRFNGDSGNNYVTNQSTELSCVGLFGGVSSVVCDATNIDIFCGKERIHALGTCFTYQDNAGICSYHSCSGAYMGCGAEGLESIDVVTNKSLSGDVEIILYGVLK